MTNDITVDKLYLNFMGDPSFKPPEGVRKEDAARKMAEQIYRQHMNNIMALSLLSKGTSNQYIIDSKTQTLVKAIQKFADFMKPEYNIELDIKQLKR